MIGDNLDRWLLWLAGLLTAAALYLGLVAAPAEAVMGDVYRIVYFHVAAAWNAFLAFFVVAVGSVIYLLRRDDAWDRAAASSAEIGVLFTTVTLVMGTFWARYAWGTWWTWEPRLTTTLLLWFIYVGYLLIRQLAADDSGPKRLAAMFGIFGFVDVPVVYLSVTWWRGLHPDTVSPEGVTMTPLMVTALVVSVVAFTVLYAVLLRLSTRIGRLQAEVDRRRWRRAEKGSDAPGASPPDKPPAGEWEARHQS